MRLDTVIADRFDKLVGDGAELSSHWRADSYASWIASTMILVERVFGIDSPHRKHLEDFNHKIDVYGNTPYFMSRLRGTLTAAREDYIGGYFSRTRSLLRAEITEDVLAQAEDLLSADFKDAACVVAGVALENALRDLRERQNIPDGKLERVNADLAAKEVYNKGMQKQITAWAHWRNKAAHGEWDDYTADDVHAMIDGVRRFISEYV